MMLNLIVNTAVEGIPLEPLTNPSVPWSIGVEGGVGLDKIISNVLGLATIGAGIILIAYLILGAFRYATAGGDTKATSDAQKMITNAIVGLIIVILATVLASIIGAVLGVDLLGAERWGIIGETPGE